MSIINNENLMTCVQVKRKLKSIDTEQSDIKIRLIDLVEQFQCLDRVANSIGLVKEGFSFVNRVSWENVLSKLGRTDKNKDELEEVKIKDILGVISQSSDQLENELIPQLQKWRNSWMLEVILIEFVFFILLGLIIAGITHTLGLWNMSNINISFQPFLYERPVFSLIVLIISFICFVSLHFKIRNFVAKRLAIKLNKKSSEFDLAAAFLKNTRMQHSIFRPDIIGWGWLGRKCLLKNSTLQN